MPLLDTSRDRWWFIGGRNKLLREGLPGTALIKAYEDKVATAGSTGEADITMEVRVDGREPYDLQGLFKRDGAKEATERAGRRVYEPGSIVAVRVHPKTPKRVAIDWANSPPE